MTTTVQILSTNFYSEIADITFYPCSGGTISLGNQVLPYNYISLDDNYTGTYELVISAYSTTCSFSIPCVSPTPTVTTTPNNSPTPTPTITPTITQTPTNTPTYTPSPTITGTNTPTPTNTPTYTPTNTQTPSQTPSPTTPFVLPIGAPLYSFDNEQVYYFDINTQTTGFYYNFGFTISAMTRDDNYLWLTNFAAAQIKEYDITSYPPTLIRTIDTATNGIKIYGMFNYGTNQLIATDDTNNVNIIDISASPATKTPLFSHGGSNQPYSNILRDNNIGITYLKTSTSTITAYYDDGTFYATSTITGETKGLFRDCATSEIFAINTSGQTFNIPQNPGTVTATYAGTISPDDNVNVGVAQSDSCIPPLSSFYMTSDPDGMSAATILYSSSTFNWINWGDSIYVSGGTASYPAKQFGTHTYSPPLSGGTITIYSYDNFSGLTYLNPQSTGTTYEGFNGPFLTSELQKITGLKTYVTNYYNDQFFLSGPISELPPLLESISVNIAGTNLTGLTNDFPSGMIFASFIGSLSGDTSGLPSTFKVLSQYIAYVSGDTSGLPYGMESISLVGPITISGNTSGFTSTLNGIGLAGFNTISGNVSDLPKVTTSQYVSYPSISISGFNTISGDTSGFLGGYPRDLRFGGYNTISGNTSGFPNTITYLDMEGYNTIGGYLSGFTFTANSITIIMAGENQLIGDGSFMPSGVTALNISNRNAGISGSTIGGDISTYSTTGSGLLTLDIRAANTINGNISGVSTSITTLTILGNNTITGDIGNIPNVGVNKSYTIDGNNTLFGNISGIPASIRTLNIDGNNTISGDISGLSSLASTTKSITINGNNTISGSISGLSNSYLTTLDLRGSNTIVGPVNGIYIPSMVNFYLFPVSPGGLTSSEVDDLLVYFTGVTTIKNIRLQGTNAAPGATGLAAKAILTGSPYFASVITN